MAAKNSYEVGYSRPPKASQFKKGQSGNPGGRAKRSNDLLSALLRVLRQTITIEEGGRKRKVSKLQAIVVRLVNRAANGDLQAITVLSRHQARKGGPAAKQKPPGVKVRFQEWPEEMLKEK